MEPEAKTNIILVHRCHVSEREWSVYELDDPYPQLWNNVFYQLCNCVLYLATAHVCLLLCKMMYCDVTSFYCVQYSMCVPVDVLFFESLSFLHVKYITTTIPL